MLLDDTYYENFANQRPCTVCDGTGISEGEICPICDGSCTVADRFDDSGPDVEFYLSTVLYRPEENPLSFTSAKKFILEYLDGGIERTFHMTFDEYMELVPADAKVLYEIGSKKLKSEVEELDTLNRGADIALKDLTKGLNMKDINMKDFNL